MYTLAVRDKEALAIFAKQNAPDDSTLGHILVDLKHHTKMCAHLHGHLN